MGRHTKPHTGKLYQPTDDQRRQVLAMTGFGIRQEEICTSLQIDKKTLHKHFRRELDTGMTEANVRVARALYQNAVQHNNVAAQIWWTKTRMGWKEAKDINVTGDVNVLHLLAAQAISEELQVSIQTAQQSNTNVSTAPTIDGDLLDAPLPTE